jgi:hypothetical protein
VGEKGKTAVALKYEASKSLKLASCFEIDTFRIISGDSSKIRHGFALSFDI